ncbi:hypothetical protein D3C80_1235950 [compost metagenome]
MPAAVLVLSGRPLGGWLSPVSGALPRTVTASLSMPPAADFTVTWAGGWNRPVTVRLCRVPALLSRPKPVAARSGISTSSLEVASMVSVPVSRSKRALLIFTTSVSGLETAVGRVRPAGSLAVTTRNGGRLCGKGSLWKK